MRWFVLAGLAVACGGDKSDSGDTASDTPTTATGGATTSGSAGSGGVGTGTATGTGTGTGTGGTDPTTTPTFSTPGDVVAASCALQADNALRAECTITRDGEGPVALQLNGPGFRATRLLESTSDATEHAIDLWGMLPNTTYSWVATAGGLTVEGELRTGSPPISLSGSTGGDAATATIDGMLVRSCSDTDYLVVYSPRGDDIVWYEDLSTHASDRAAVYGYHWAEDDTVVVATTRDEVIVLGADGSLQLRASLSALGVEGLLHHDIYKANGYVYALFAYEVDDCILDGVAVIDGDGSLAGVVDLGTTFEPPRCSAGGGGGGPGPGGGYWGRDLDGEDVSHANSVYVDPTGELVVSFRFFDTVIGLDGDPTSPTFGELRWALEGEDGAEYESSFSLESDVTPDASFQANHCAQFAPTGELTVFDNGNSGLSRALVIDLDLGAGVADITEVYEPGLTCGVQSAIYKHAEDGSVLLTCATEPWFAEFDEGSAAPRWTYAPSCSGMGPGGMIPRGIPVNW